MEYSDFVRGQMLGTLRSVKQECRANSLLQKKPRGELSGTVVTQNIVYKAAAQQGLAERARASDLAMALGQKSHPCFHFANSQLLQRDGQQHSASPCH